MVQMQTRRWNVLMAAVAAGVAAVLLSGCGGDSDGNQANGPDTTGDTHGHHHDAPHHGTLVVLGGDAHTGHLEFLLDADTGTLTLWVLDGEARGSIRLKEHSIALELRDLAGTGDVDDGNEPVQLQLDAQSSSSTGETPGDSSEFRALHDRLKGAETFTIHIETLLVRGVEQGPLVVPFPRGNEGAADSHDDHEHDHHDH